MTTEERGSKVSAAKVATQFVSTYYERLKNDPQRVHLFYQEESQVHFVDGGNTSDPVAGMEKIKDAIRQRGSEHWVLDLESGSVDAQPSKDGGVLLLVTGVLTTRNHPPRHFVQTFFLANQASNNGTSASYYILNDTLRILNPVHRAPAAAAVVASATQQPAAASTRRTPAAAAAEAPATTPAPAAAANPATSNGAPPAAPEAPAAGADPRPAANPEASSSNGAGAAPAPSSWVGVLLKAQPAQPPRPAKAAPRSSPAADAPAAAPADKPDEAGGGGAAAAAPAPAPEAAEERAPAGEAGAKAAESAVVKVEDMPSTAVFVKNLEGSMTEEDLQTAFAPFMVDSDASSMLVAPHFDRGFAFVDLASQMAVARAVSASRTEGIRVQDKKLTVEPSKKPVRASGLKAMHEKRAGGPKSGSRSGRGGGKRSGRGDKEGGRGTGGGSASSSAPASSSA